MKTNKWTDADGYSLEVNAGKLIVSSPGKPSKSLNLLSCDIAYSQLPKDVESAMRKQGINPENYMWVCAYPIRKTATDFIKSIYEEQNAEFQAQLKAKNIAQRNAAIAAGAKVFEGGWVRVSSDIVRSSDNLMRSLWVNEHGETKVSEIATH